MPTGRFVTDNGMAVPAVSAETTREADRIAIGEQAPNLFQMMENAGRSMALTAIDHLGPGWRDVLIAVLAGRGGNGGGGICAARHLANHGGDLMVVLAEPDRLSPVTPTAASCLPEDLGSERAECALQAGSDPRRPDRL